MSNEPENTQRNDILISLKEMLEELTNEEVTIIEDYMVTQCSVDCVDEYGNAPNLFRTLIIDQMNTISENE